MRITNYGNPDWIRRLADKCPIRWTEEDDARMMDQVMALAYSYDAMSRCRPRLATMDAMIDVLQSLAEPVEK